MLLFIVVCGVILACYAWALIVVDPQQPIWWTRQVLLLCLVVAAIAGRSLVGFHPVTRPKHPIWHPALPYFLIVLAAILPYMPSLRVGFLSDDFGLAWAAREADSALDAMTSEAFISFFRPIPLLLWWIGDRVWHGNSLGYHVLSLLVHTVNSILVFLLGRRLIGSVLGGLLAALVFAIHPLHIEPVTWLAANSDLLCTSFCLASLLALERRLATNTTRFAGILASLTFFILALFSKEAAFALPAIAILRLALDERPGIRARLRTVGGAYLVVLLAYGAFRFSILRGIGGYSLPLSFWNTVFPSQPLLVIGDFFFPIHTTLFSHEFNRWLQYVIAGALHRVPGRRLWLWLGFLFLASVPTWLFRWQGSAALEWSRFAYLPTIGLCWLFGDLYAARGQNRRGAFPAFVILVGLIVLTLWYQTPWIRATRLANETIAAGVSLVTQLTTSAGPPSLYVADLPQEIHGAPVFANCYPQALNLATGQFITTQVVSERPRAGIHPDVMAATPLRPGEYLVSWDAQKGDLRIIRTGTSRSALISPEEMP